MLITLLVHVQSEVACGKEKNSHHPFLYGTDEAHNHDRTMLFHAFFSLSVLGNSSIGDVYLPA